MTVNISGRASESGRPGLGLFISEGFVPQLRCSLFQLIGSLQHRETLDHFSDLQLEDFMTLSHGLLCRRGYCYFTDE